MTREQLIRTFLSIDSDMNTGGKAKEKLNKIFDLMEKIIRDSNPSNLNDNNDVSLFVYQTITAAKQNMVQYVGEINSASYKIVTKLKESESEE